jgi:hypothetical protein
MLDHPVLATALGLIFFYVVLSLVVSAVQEWLASLLALRARNLRAGVARLVGEAEAARLYDHPLIRRLAQPGQLPSYISPDTLSAVALDLVAKDGGERGLAADEDGGALVDKIAPDHPLRPLLDPLVDRGVDTAAAVRTKLADWFDEGMTRISGWYRRRVKLFVVVIAGVLTVATNASSTHLAADLWRNDALRATLAAEAAASVRDGDLDRVRERVDAARLEAFPIGWRKVPATALGWLQVAFGWLVTVAAVSLGAPFWFDLLGRVADLKGTGGPAHRRGERD